MAVRISTEKKNGQGVVVTVSGEVDLETAAVVEEAVADGTEAARSPLVVLDLSAVSFFGSAGIAAIVRAQERCARSGVGFAVVASTAVRRPLELVGLTQRLPLHATVDDAFAAAGAIFP
jgi:anti-anti-sigma factor